MKKVKILLGVFATVAVVGSALAFKASNFNTHFIFTKGSGSNGTCTVKTTSAEIGGVANQTYASTSSKSSNCPLNFTRAITD